VTSLPRQRFRTITPTQRFAWLFRITGALFGAMALLTAGLMIFIGPSTTSTVNFLFFAAFAALSATRFGIRLGVNDESLLVAKHQLSMVVVSWRWVAGFEWRHNLLGMGQPSKRLWVILDDGQQLSTPVVKGKVWLADRDITLSDTQADDLVAELERRRDGSHQRRPQPEPA
jgi:hypothetical protein